MSPQPGPEPFIRPDEVSGCGEDGIPLQGNHPDPLCRQLLHRHRIGKGAEITVFDKPPAPPRSSETYGGGRANDPSVVAAVSGEVADAGGLPGLRLGHDPLRAEAPEVHERGQGRVVGGDET